MQLFSKLLRWFNRSHREKIQPDIDPCWLCMNFKKYLFSNLWRISWNNFLNKKSCETLRRHQRLQPHNDCGIADKLKTATNIQLVWLTLSLPIFWSICFLSATFTLTVKGYKKRRLLRCIHNFKSDLFNNMDHMWMSGTEPSSVILSQSVVSKIEKIRPKMPKTSLRKRGWCISSRKLRFNQFCYRKFWCSQNPTNQSKSAVELGYMCPRGLIGPPAVTLPK